MRVLVVALLFAHALAAAVLAQEAPPVAAEAAPVLTQEAPPPVAAEAAHVLSQEAPPPLAASAAAESSGQPVDEVTVRGANTAQRLRASRPRR